MNSANRSRWYWGFFVLVLLAAVFGWLLVLQRLVNNEAEVAQARVRVAEERYLGQVADDLLVSAEERLLELGHGETMIPKLAKEGAISGVWFEPKYEKGSAFPRVVEEWRGKIRARSVDVSVLKEALEEGELSWGWVEDGRDVVAGMVMSLISRNGSSGDAVKLIRERVWNYEGPSLSPSFRLALIRELQKNDDDPALARLALAESIRLAEGELGELDKGQDYEVIESRKDNELFLSFWTKSQLESLVPNGETEVEFLGVAEEDRSGVRIAGFTQWPVLSFRKNGNASSLSVEQSGTALLWIGGLTGFAVLALTIAAAIMASRASKVARMRTDLAASVAHELRTPLAGQRLLLESLLERGDQTEEEKKEYVEMAFRENKRLSRLAEEFLTFSRLERGVLTLEMEEVDVSEAAESAVESLRDKWEESETSLSIDVGDALPEVAGDSQAVVTVLRNLLENAWKYSQAPREVELKASEEGEGVSISVSDNGVGLSEKEKGRIFRQFYRADRRLARSQDGLGLGLSIVQRLVEAMDGRVEVESQEGKGSEFKIWLRAVS